MKRNDIGRILIVIGLVFLFIAYIEMGKGGSELEYVPVPVTTLG